LNDADQIIKNCNEKTPYDVACELGVCINKRNKKGDYAPCEKGLYSEYYGRNYESYTVFDVACANGHLDISKFLVNNGAK